MSARGEFEESEIYGLRFRKMCPLAPRTSAANYMVDRTSQVPYGFTQIQRRNRPV